MRLVQALPLCALLFVGCASTSSGSSGDASPVAEKPSSSKSEGDKSKVEELNRKLDLAKARLKIKEMEEEAFLQQQESDMGFADAAVAVAEMKLATFREADAPNRVASEELSLRGARDRAQEAKEELAQIEIMYKDQDLDDLTAEFVVSRGRRRAERAQKSIEIQEAGFKALTDRKLPAEQKELELKLERARAAQRKTKREGEIGRQKQAVGVQEARNAILDLEEKIAETSEKASS